MKQLFIWIKDGLAYFHATIVPEWHTQIQTYVHVALGGNKLKLHALMSNGISPSDENI